MLSRSFPALLLVTAVVGCSTFSPAGLIAASRLDPLQTSPADISVAVSVPEDFAIQNGDAALFLGFVPEEADKWDPVAVTVPLSVDGEMQGPRQPEQGEAIFVLNFAQSDASALAAAQHQIRALRAAGVEGKGTLSVSVEGGCWKTDPAETLPIATWLRTRPAGDFVALTRRTDLFEAMALEERAEFVAQQRVCQ